MLEETLRVPALGPSDLGPLILRGAFSQLYAPNRVIENIRTEHHSMALVCSAAGSVTLAIDQGTGLREVEVSEGSCAIVSQKDVLTSTTADAPWQMYWYNFMYLTPGVIPACQVFDRVDTQEMARVFDLVSERIKSKKIWQRRYAVAVFSTLLTRILGESASAAQPDDPAHAIDRVTNFLADNLHRVVPVEEMAEIAEMSVSLFRKRFKAIMGVSYKAHYDKLRVETGFSMLAAGGSAKEVAERLGYSDQFHFSRACRRVSLSSPRQIQKRFGHSQRKDRDH